VARSTVATVLKDNGIPPAPDRPSSWRTFLRAHWGEIAGADFFTTEVWTPRGLITYDTLFVLDLRSRQVHVVGSTPTPDGGCMAQAARRLTDAVDGFLAGHRILICDRDTKWTDGFHRIVQGAGAWIVGERVGCGFGEGQVVDRAFPGYAIRPAFLRNDARMTFRRPDQGPGWASRARIRPATNRSGIDR
jgi:hypothetical protein